MDAASSLQEVTGVDVACGPLTAQEDALLLPRLNPITGMLLREIAAEKKGRAATSVLMCAIILPHPPSC